MKGQYLTLEYVIFFAIGIVMIISVYYSFSDLKDKYEAATTEYQLRMTGELVMGNAIRLFLASNNTDSKIAYDLKIPSRLSDCIYSISLVNGFLRLECVDFPIRVDLTSYNFNINIKNNILYSTQENVHFIVKEGVIDLE